MVEHRGRAEACFYPFLNLYPRWGWVVKATLRPLYPLWRNPGSHSTGGGVGLRAGLTGAGNLTANGVWTPNRQARSDSLYRLSYHGRRVMKDEEILSSNFCRRAEIPGVIWSHQIDLFMSPLLARRRFWFKSISKHFVFMGFPQVYRNGHIPLLHQTF